MFSVTAVFAEEGKWIDGIRLQFGDTSQSIVFFTDRSDETGGQSIIRKSQLENENPTSLYPIAIALPESLMNSWSFRGAFIEYSDRIKTNDLSPHGDDSGTYRRQESSSRTFLINNFFNDDDKQFINGKDKWALTADTNLQMIFLGYYWGVFIPIGNSHRLLKMGLGVTATYTDASIKLNLCEEYKIVDNSGECIGKKEIDSASKKVYSSLLVVHLTLWERKIKSSLWRLASITTTLEGQEGGLNFNYKNHPNTIQTFPTASNITFFSYTYRF